MDIKEFVATHTHFGFDFSQPISQQGRIFAMEVLAQLPAELTPSYEYRGGGRGRPNLNQTLTHSQCATCKRVLRNDHFYAVPSMMRKNVLFSHCKDCTQQNNAIDYDTNSAAMRSNRASIWQYLVKRCSVCGFDQHASALDLHCGSQCNKAQEARIIQLVDALAAQPAGYNGEKLLRAIKHGIPLCSNCHRMVHAGALPPPEPAHPTRYHLVELLDLLKNR